MLRSLYISASGMLAQRSTMDVITNNLSNLDTIGYKRDSLETRSFGDVLLSRINDPSGNNGVIGPLSLGVHPDTVNTDFSEGPLEPTGRTADLALQGDGFFTVETPQGLRYTRSGNFQVDKDGYLCTSEGYYVRGTNGRIHVGSQDFTVGSDGTITSAGGNYKLQIVQFANNTALRKVGNNLYSGPAVASLANCGVMQGYLEHSNVDLSTEMVNMITVSRNYEANQRMVSMINGTLDKACNEVGRV
jgi:flagellar basal-body rod protein FlgG